MKKINLTFVVLIMLQMHAFCQLKNYNDKGCIRILADRATLTITGIEVKLKADKQMAGLIAAAGSILPPAADFIIKTIEEKVAKNVLAYQGEYKCFNSSEKFYRNNDFASLPKLTIKRTIKTTDGVDQTAAELDLLPELSEDKTAFRYFIFEKCIYNYSIAKTKRKYDYIDLNLEINFRSISVDKEEYKISNLRTTTIDVPLVHVGITTHLDEKIYSGWIPLPPRSTAKVNEPVIEKKDTKTVIKTNNAGVKDTTREETIHADYNVEDFQQLSDNTGLYEIDIKVTETNPYKIKASNRQELMENTGDSMSKLLKSIIGSFTTE
jgi:hypothetical protein